MQTQDWIIRRTESIAEGGMVAAKHPLAAEAGLRVLQEGGNAIDAAITTALAMGVVEPYMSGIGGGGFMLYQDAESGESHFLDYFMPAPANATPDMYEIETAGATDTLGFRGVKDDANLIGHRAVGVPGLIAGAAAALERFGTISLADALAPAIGFAGDGFPVSWYTMLRIANAMELISRFPATAEIFLKDGRFVPNADTPAGPNKLIQSDLARSMQQIADGGSGVFYGGAVGKAIVDELSAHGNPMTLADLTGYEAQWSTPRRVTYRDGYELVFAPNTGGTTLAETFNLLEHFSFAGMKATDPEALHLFIEAAKIAYADRWQHLADERTVDVPWRQLESKEYARQRITDIDRAKAAVAVKAGQFGNGQASAPEGDGGCTTHLSVVDRNRNMVSITQTINMVFGSGVTAAGTGILLNDTMVLFDPNPGRANSIAGGKRPLSSMTPMMVLKDGKPFLTVGAPGGRLIIGTVMKVIHNVIDLGMGIQEACDQVLVDASTPKILTNAAMGEAAIAGLTAMGHDLNLRQQDFLPRLFAIPTGILVDPQTGKLHGGADSYHPGVAIGY
ncbi:MAG: gamma-glutamyltransferase [Caldilineaceae bacterium]|nr:gamma-glutamyltransferase [Caldilineaceae bacterium]